MVNFVFGPEEVARVRFAFSPNWELVSSVRALRRPSAHALHVPWAEEALRPLRGFDMSLLLALIGVAAFADLSAARRRDAVGSSRATRARGTRGPDRRHTRGHPRRALDAAVDDRT